MNKRVVQVKDRMEKKYAYVCIASIGKNFDREYKPQHSRKQRQIFPHWVSGSQKI